MAGFPILSVMLLVPLLAAVACLLVEAKAAEIEAGTSVSMDTLHGKAA